MRENKTSTAMREPVAQLGSIEFGRGEWLPERDALQRELQRLLASARFRSRPVLGKLLTYLVERLADDAPAALREVAVGTEVFGRDRATFDPQSDAIVRVTASRLRRQLAEHYASDGRDSELIIELRLGSYVPHVRRRSFPSTPLPQTVAVLPFRRADSPSHDDAFCDGLTEDIIDALSRVSGARVIAAGSSFALGKQPTAAEAMLRLEADYLLIGEVRTLAGLIKLSVRLDEARGTTLWSFACLLHERDLAQAQASIVGDVVETLLPHLGSGASSLREPDPAPRAIDPAARELHHRARMLLRQGKPALAERALELAQEAMRIEPTFAAAFWVAGSASYFLWSTSQQAAAQTLPRARRYLAEALRLDPRLVQALALQARLLYSVDADWKGAAVLFERALQLQPNRAAVLHGYGKFLMLTGRLDEALEMLLRACGTDPLNPLLRCELGMLLMAIDQLPKALQVFAEVLEIQPGLFSANVGSVAALLALNRLDEAEVAIAAFEREHGAHPYAVHLRCRLLARRGQLDLARARLETLAQAKPHAVTQLDWAEHWVTAGQFDRAFEALRRAVDEHACGTHFVHLSPEFRPLHADPRWNDMLRKLGLIDGDRVPPHERKAGADTARGGAARRVEAT